VTESNAKGSRFAQCPLFFTDSPANLSHYLPGIHRSTIGIA
jgi:hypothetical protein